MNRLVVAKGEERGNGIDLRFGVSRCKLLHLKWINNKVLLYSTGNCIQSPGTEHDGKEYKNYIYIYVTLMYSRNWHNTVNQLYFHDKKQRVKASAPMCIRKQALMSAHLK